MKLLKSFLLIVIFFSFFLCFAIGSQCQELQLQKITEHLYMVSGGGGNVAFLVTNEGILVVDSGITPTLGKEIVAKIREVSNKPIQYLIITHYHRDHVLGAQSFPQTTTIISHINTRKNIEKLIPSWIKEQIEKIYPDRIKELEQKVQELKEQKSPELEKVQKELKEIRKSIKEYKQTNFVLPFFTFRTKSVIHLGGKTIELLYMGPGHTDGDILVYFPEEKAIHIGDLLFTAPYLDQHTGASAKNWIKIYNKIADMDVEIIIPGHGETTDKTEYKKAVQMTIAYLNDLYAEVEKYVKQEVSLEETKKSLTLPKYQELSFYKELLQRHVEAVYKEITAKKKSQ